MDKSVGSTKAHIGKFKKLHPRPNPDKDKQRQQPSNTTYFVAIII